MSDFTLIEGEVGIYDGAIGPATVKDANTTPTATDKALVVATSPNQAATKIEGKFAREATDVPLPVIMGGRYAGDSKLKELATDSVGRLIMVGDTVSGKTLVLNYQKSAVIAGAFANQFFKGLHYPIPANYKYNIGLMLASSEDNRCSFRLGRTITFGTFNVGTNTYSDASVGYTLPEFASHLDVEVTTTFGNSAAVTISITYINQDNVAGRTATVVLNKQAWPAGIKLAATLQGDDYGVTDVTAVSSVGAETGIVNINGVQSLWRRRVDTADSIVVDSFSKDVMIARAGNILALDYLSNGGATVTRTIRAVGVLEPV
jgi:hypothetical protein